MTTGTPELLSRERHLLGPTQRVLNWSRLALALHALVFNLVRSTHPDVAHPVLLILASVVMVTWTLLAWALNRGRVSSLRPVQIADVMITLLLVSCSAWVLGPAVTASNFTTVTVLWQIGAPLSAAIAWGAVPGLLVGVLVGLAGFVQAPSLEPSAWTPAFGTCLIAWGVGQLVSQLRSTMEQRDQQFARAAVLAERDRMARLVHDGALQVLSMVEREGASLGPRGQRLALLAKSQEVQLRTALQDRSVHTALVDDDDELVDLVSMVDAHANEWVTVSTMAGRLMVEHTRATEVDAAITQVLHNVSRHAGEGAEAWILVEEGDDEVMIAIRDNGKGMTMADLAEALASDRMGMRASIRGRIEDLGGTAKVMSAPGRGVEWELVVPLPPIEEARRGDGGS